MFTVSGMKLYFALFVCFQTLTIFQKLAIIEKLTNTHVTK